MTNFKIRSNEKEMMDDLESADGMAQTLHELKVINKWLGGNDVTLRGLNKLLENRKSSVELITIADLGCGGGDMLLEIAKWARRKKLKVALVGIDANPNIIEYAKANTRKYPEITYLNLNIFSVEFILKKFDIITATLFTHHFTNAELEILYKQIEKQVSMGVVINDLHRHWFAYHSIKLITQLFSKSKMVINDGPISVSRGFKLQELLDILSNAEISKFHLSWKWAFRWELVIEK